jgi:hypothetical protein
MWGIQNKRHKCVTGLNLNELASVTRRAGDAQFTDCLTRSHLSNAISVRRLTLQQNCCICNKRTSVFMWQQGTHVKSNVELFSLHVCRENAKWSKNSECVRPRHCHLAVLHRAVLIGEGPLLLDPKLRQFNGVHTSASVMEQIFQVLICSRKSPPFYWALRFITVFVRSLLCSKYWAAWMQSTPYYPIYQTYTLILSSHLYYSSCLHHITATS